MFSNSFIADSTTHSPAKEANRMSIGSWRYSLTSSAKSLDKSTYCFKGSQVQQLVARSLLFVVSSFIAVILLLQNPVDAGVLKADHQRPKANDFFDWKYAQKVWFEMDTRALADAEWDKYEKDFQPWLDIYKSDQRRAFEELKNYPKQKKSNIMRGYDIQLAYDTWFDQIYMFWFKNYEYHKFQSANTGRPAATFDDLLEGYRTRGTCFPKQILDECGPVPDWRSEKWLAKEKEMMAKVQVDLDEAIAAKARKGKK